MGNVYDAEKNLNKALDCYEKSLAIKKRILGDRHISISATLNNIGNIYESKGDHASALDSYHRSLSIKKKI